MKSLIVKRNHNKRARVYLVSNPGQGKLIKYSDGEKIEVDLDARIQSYSVENIPQTSAVGELGISTDVEANEALNGTAVYNDKIEELKKQYLEALAQNNEVLKNDTSQKSNGSD